MCTPLVYCFILSHILTTRVDTMRADAGAGASAVQRGVLYRVS